MQNFDPERVTNKVLHETFERYGVVLSAKVATDAGGRSKGYGFIQFEDPQNAARAIEGLNNTQLCGQTLFVGPFVPAKARFRSRTLHTLLSPNTPVPLYLLPAVGGQRVLCGGNVGVKVVVRGVD